MMNFFSVNNALKEYDYKKKQQIIPTLLIHIMDKVDILKLIHVIKK